VQLEGLGQLKNPMTSGMELATFRLVTKCPNQLSYRVPHTFRLVIWKLENWFLMSPADVDVVLPEGKAAAGVKLSTHILL
jgi:hypothetical protein